MRKLIRISALVMALFMLLSVIGCRKTTDQSSGEWLSERDYYYYEAGNWVEITDDSFFDNLENEETEDDNQTDEGNQTVDSSSYQTLIDYCGNDGYDKLFEHKNITRNPSFRCAGG